MGDWMRWAWPRTTPMVGEPEVTTVRVSATVVLPEVLDAVTV